MRDYVRSSFARLGLLSVIICAIGFSACASSTARATKDPFSGVPVAHVGDTVKLGANWSAVINSVTTSYGAGTVRPTDNDVFVLVDVTFTNISTQDLDLYTVTPFTLRDGNGQRYTQISTPLTVSPDGTVAAGATVHGVIPFEVPLTQHQFLLAYYTGIANDPHAIWSFSI